MTALQRFAFSLAENLALTLLTDLSPPICSQKNLKRELKKSLRERSSLEATGESGKSAYHRRSLAVSGTAPIETMRTASSEARMSLQDFGNQAQFLQDYQTDNNEPMTTGSLPSDMLILNNSQLIQRQPYNLSSFDEIVKLLPADLEFIDQQPESSLEPYLAAALSQQFALSPIQNYSQPTMKPSGENKTTKSPKTLHSYMRRLASIYYPVQQQLASMLASQSPTSNGNTGSTGNHPGQMANPALAGSQSAASQAFPQMTSSGVDQSASQGGSGSFSLSSLVPKSKIDLSKSTISKKLNKLRFKSGRKYELQQAKPSQPPTPANEFNYDIFNNQLAQLEKQQKQLQSLEMAASWPPQQQQQQQGDSFNYLPMMTVPSEEQQAIDSMNNPQATQILLSNIQQQQQQPVYNSHLQMHQPQLGGLKQQLPTNSYQQQRYPPPRQPLRYSEIPLGPPNNLGQQPYVIDYLSMMFNRTAESPASSRTPPSSKQQQDSAWPSMNQASYQYTGQASTRQQPQPQSPQQAPNNRPYVQQKQQQYQQPAIYITRLPQPLSYPLFEAIKSQQQQQQQNQDPRLWANSVARYPNIAPYGSNQKLLAEAQTQPMNSYPTTTADYSAVNQMSTMPSLALTTHDTLENGGYSLSVGSQNLANQPEVESLSGSGSGSHYDFRQRPTKAEQSSQMTVDNMSGSGSSLKSDPSRFQQSPELDHMLAIERFSKQSSERRLPSIVHPVTGEHVHVPVAQLSDLDNVNNQQRNNQLEAGNFSNQALPRRFSALLIDKHLVASSSEPTPVQANEFLEVDQTTRAGDLRRINISDTNNPMHQQPTTTRIVLISSEGDPSKMHQRVGSSFANLTSNQQQPPNNNQQLISQSTTESVTPVLVKPNNFDYYREQASVSSSPPSTSPTTTTTTATISAASEGPLTPSFGPPTVGSNVYGGNDDGSNKLADDDLVYKSTLVEPITSTLMHTPSLWHQPSKSHQVNQFNFDTNPFTPIELTNPLYYATNPQQFAASNLLASRLRPPFIESMLSQHESPFRPEPPVQVASYLAQHLTSHSPMFISSERSVASSQPMALSVSIPAASGSSPDGRQQQQQQQTTQSSNQNSNRTNDLIILKPAVLAKQSPQTYLLKPEYLTNQFKLVGGDGSSSLANSADLYYTNEIGDSAARRLAGHQFDRLSSLSSPPSTSIALDPMQAANTMASYARHGLVNESQSGEPLGANSKLSSKSDGQNQSTQQMKSPSRDSSNTTTIVVEATSGTGNADKLAQHRQTTYLPSKPIPFSFETSSSLSSSNPEGLRLNPGGDSSTMNRDNNTDNAILSHVMSLISSNAIPTPPLIPVASYSSADYFLPTSDRFHRSLRG